MVTSTTYRPSVAVLVEQANEAHTRYPQYAGHWDTWTRALITRDVKTKMGLAFRKGDVVLVSPETHSPECGPYVGKTFHMCYSFRNRVDTSVPATAVTLLGT